MRCSTLDIKDNTIPDIGNTERQGFQDVYQSRSTSYFSLQRLGHRMATRMILSMQGSSPTQTTSSALVAKLTTWQRGLEV
jgi:hypothetical protein